MKLEQMGGGGGWGLLFPFNYFGKKMFLGLKMQRKHEIGNQNCGVWASYPPLRR